MKLRIDTFNRLSLGIIEKDHCTPEEALQKLALLQINLVCGKEIATSLPLQAALISAVNSAKRAFLGGTFVKLPENIPCLLPWPRQCTLNQIVEELGGRLTADCPADAFTLNFALPGLIDNNAMQVVCNNWLAGVTVNGEFPAFCQSGDIPTAGIFAGAYSVCLAFHKVSGINIAACDHSQGISLWRPDLDWLEKDAQGPVISFLPKKYWMLGLGHLGQAYLWNIGLLPYETPQDVTILLQDDDKIVEANQSAGLLSEANDIGFMKARICSRWLEQRKFQTFLSERRYDCHTQRTSEEPFLALCGFDSGASRLPLENGGFDLIVESGLGGKLGTFDMISLHTFPGGSKTPEELWGETEETAADINEEVYKILEQTYQEEACGILPLTIAGKSISASFVGACSAALVIAELLRGLHGGRRYDKINLQLRDLANRKAVIHSKVNYQSEHSRNGFVLAKKCR